MMQLYTPRSLTQLLSGIKHFINSKSEPTEPDGEASRYIKCGVQKTTERP